MVDLPTLTTPESMKENKNVKVIELELYIGLEQDDSGGTYEKKSWCWSLSSLKISWIGNLKE